MRSGVPGQFLRFALVGAIGFVVDTAALYFSLKVLGVGPYAGRVFSYFVAATSTWALNRRYTFQGVRSNNRFAEWARFIAANAAGGIANYGCYALLMMTVEVVRSWPVLGVAAGSVAGLAINFTLSRRIVFTGDRAKP